MVIYGVWLPMIDHVRQALKEIDGFAHPFPFDEQTATEIATIVANLRRAAIEKGYPTVAKACRVNSLLLSVQQAYEVIAECLSTFNLDQEWYSPSEVAGLLGKSDYTIRERWCNGGRIECEKNVDTGKWQIPGHEVSRLLAGGQLHTPAK